MRSSHLHHSICGVVVDMRSHLGDKAVVVACNNCVVGIQLVVHHHMDIPLVFPGHRRGEEGEDNSNDAEQALDALVVHQNSMDLFRQVHPAYYLDPLPLPLVVKVVKVRKSRTRTIQPHSPF
jgi:hypothetical protein